MHISNHFTGCVGKRNVSQNCVVIAVQILTTSILRLHAWTWFQSILGTISMTVEQPPMLSLSDQVFLIRIVLIKYKVSKPRIVSCSAEVAYAN